MLNSSGESLNFVFFVVSSFPSLHYVSYHGSSFLPLFFDITQPQGTPSSQFEGIKMEPPTLH